MPLKGIEKNPFNANRLKGSKRKRSHQRSLNIDGSRSEPFIIIYLLIVTPSGAAAAYFADDF
jgi:hypothetical protein